MEEYLAAHSPVAPKIEGRAVATDAPSTLLTQVLGLIINLNEKNCNTDSRFVYAAFLGSEN